MQATEVDVKTRIAGAISGALLAIAMMAAPTLAGSNVEVTITRGIVIDAISFASYTCGFTIELHTVGMDVDIRHYDADGNLQSETLQQVYDGYLLNPANGKSVASRVAGPIRDVVNADGTISETTTGATVRTAPGSGIVSGFIGHDRVTLVATGEIDEDGSPVYDVGDETFNGLFLGTAGVCDMLR
jgi:hypothetical protein